MELQGSMEGNHRVVRELRGQEIRIHRRLCGLQSRGNHGVEAAVDMEVTSLLDHAHLLKVRTEVRRVRLAAHQWNVGPPLPGLPPPQPPGPGRWSG